MEYEVCLTLLHMASTGNRIPDLLIFSPMPYPLDRMQVYFWHCEKRYRTNDPIEFVNICNVQFGPNNQISIGPLSFDTLRSEIWKLSVYISIPVALMYGMNYKICIVFSLFAIKLDA